MKRFISLCAWDIGCMLYMLIKISRWLSRQFDTTMKTNLRVTHDPLCGTHQYVCYQAISNRLNDIWPLLVHSYVRDSIQQSLRFLVSVLLVAVLCHLPPMNPDKVIMRPAMQNQTAASRCTFKKNLLDNFMKLISAGEDFHRVFTRCGYEDNQGSWSLMWTMTQLW